MPCLRSPCGPGRTQRPAGAWVSSTPHTSSHFNSLHTHYWPSKVTLQTDSTTILCALILPCPEFIIALFSHLSVPSSFHLLHTYIICSSHSFRILQRNGTNRIYVEKKVLRAGECEICMIGCRPREELTLQS